MPRNPNLFSFPSFLPDHTHICQDLQLHIENFMDEQHSQEFRARLSSEIIAIPTRHDPKTGQQFIRWKDIQQYFRNAQGVLNGKVAVLFLTSDDFEE
jgi:hypothetical protein